MLVSDRDSRSCWALGVLRVAPSQVVRVSLQGDRWWFFGSHWFGRVFICSGDGCPGCMVSQPRVMGYRVGLVEGSARWRPYLVEASSGTVAGLDGFCTMEGYGSVGGLVVEAGRRTKRSPLRLEPVSADGPTLPADRATPATLNAVAVLYGLPLMQAGEEPADWADRVRGVAAAHLSAAVAGALR